MSDTPSAAALELLLPFFSGSADDARALACRIDAFAAQAVATERANLVQRCRGECKGHPFNCFSHPNDCPCVPKPAARGLERATRAIREATDAFNKLVGQKTFLSEGAEECYQTAIAAALAEVRREERERLTDEDATEAALRAVCLRYGFVVDTGGIYNKEIQERCEQDVDVILAAIRSLSETA